MYILISIIIGVPFMALSCGMWFGRHAPHRPEYDNT
jgi:hypothetical protein